MPPMTEEIAHRKPKCEVNHPIIQKWRADLQGNSHVPSIPRPKPIGHQRIRHIAVEYLRQRLRCGRATRKMLAYEIVDRRPVPAPGARQKMLRSCHCEPDNWRVE